MVALQAHEGDSDRPKDETIDDALRSLECALKILDQEDMPPHIGARLEEVIESVKGEIVSGKP
jgi:hypothetical protein